MIPKKLIFFYFNRLMLTKFLDFTKGTMKLKESEFVVRNNDYPHSLRNQIVFLIHNQIHLESPLEFFP